MKHLLQSLTDAGNPVDRFCSDERGATATEYSVMVGFIALVIIVGVGAFGLALNGVFSGMTTVLKTALGIP